MVDVSKDILIEENDLLKTENKKLSDDVKNLEMSLKRAIAKSSKLMLKLVGIRANVDYCKRFNYSQNEEYKKGWNKAFELINKCLQSDN